MDKFVKLTPAFKDYLWGGTKLRTDFNKISDKIIAESWELSCHKDGQSKVDGVDLSDYLEKNPNALGRFASLPILIKFIDAKNDLSIQVHPQDEYAQKYENDNGKTEMWVVLDCEPEAFLYYGFKKDVTKEEFIKSIEENTILDLLNKVYVKKGDVLFIEAGQVHAIGKGIVICEIQQSSNVTYRIYDYNRKDANGNTRPLHVDKAVAVSNLNHIVPSTSAQNVLLAKDNVKVEVLRTCEYFNSYRYLINDKFNITMNKDSFGALICLNGQGKISCQDSSLDFSKGETIFIPAQDESFVLNGSCEFILVTM